MARARYEITFRGEPSERLEAAFPGFELQLGPKVTILIGEVSDQAALFGVIDRIEALGLELQGVHRVVVEREQLDVS